MSLKIGQQNFTRAASTDYATYVNNTAVVNVQSKDQGTSGISYSFIDSGLRLTSGNFITSNNYYLHAIIKRLNTSQVFNIKLIQTNSAGEISRDVPEQLIKKIEVVNNNQDGDYVDVEIIFRPRDSYYNTISFELQRSQETDMVSSPRLSKIAFIELSIINNKKPTETNELSKIGVQSHPDLMMCINGEEIHMPRSGIFELRDGAIKITFFSVVNAATLNDSTPLDNLLSNESASSITFSTGASAYAKTRYIDSYTLDYMYESSEV